jgi:hypothetical protein
VNAKPVPGANEPKVKLPGTNQFVPLSEAQNLPPGTIVDVSGNAPIDLSDPTGQEMTFFGVPDGVPSTFMLNGVQNGVIQIVLIDAKTSSSSRHTSSLSAPPKKPKPPVKGKPPKKKDKPVARLWGSGHGQFTTKGKYASATVRGTIWLIADYKDHTLVTVRRGLVAVQNFVTKKTVLVPAGKSVIVYKKTPVKTPPKKHK